MDATKARARPAASRPLRSVRVSVTAGPDTGRELAGAEVAPVAIGTAADNDLQLTDPLVSRYHLELEPTADGILVRDLASLNGSWLGDVRVSACWARPPVRVTIGATVLLVADGDAEVRPGDGEPVAVEGLVGDSEGMRRVRRAIHHLAGASVNVLIRGETGTGKELVARAIHDLGPRRDRPFEVVDCGSLPATLVASELFGHERGAFTGADRRHLGAFERASGGTVFLDEIGELPMQVQPALLGALERRRFRRVGGSSEIAVDVRVLAATHQELRRQVNDGAFRADLYYRLAAARIEIPPLRERREDIESLVRHFVDVATGGTEPLPFSEETLEALRSHPWSGNARELRNVVETALAMGGVALDVTASDGAPAAAATSTDLPTYKEARAQAVDRFEQDYLRKLIDACGGNASEAARRAKVHRGYLLSLLQRHGLR